MPSQSAALSRAELAEALDRILHKGAVLRGDLVVSVADVDLLFVDLRVVLSSVDTAMKKRVLAPEPPSDPTVGSTASPDSPDAPSDHD